MPFDCGPLTGLGWAHADVACKHAGFANGVAAAVIGQSSDRLGHAVHPAVAMLNGVRSSSAPGTPREVVGLNDAHLMLISYDEHHDVLLMGTPLLRQAGLTGRCTGGAVIVKGKTRQRLPRRQRDTSQEFCPKTHGMRPSHIIINSVKSSANTSFLDAVKLET